MTEQASGVPAPASTTMDTRAALAGGEVEQLPLTDAQRAVIQADTGSWAGLLLGIPVAFVLGEIVAWVTPVKIGVHIMLAIVGPFLLSVVWIAIALWLRHQAKEDLQGGTFTRYRGRLRVETEVDTQLRAKTGITSNTYYLRLGGITRLDITGDIATALGGISVGEVDYAPHTEEIFEVRSEDGKVAWVGHGMQRVLRRSAKPQGGLVSGNEAQRP